MIKLYNKIDKNLLKKSPFQWIIGWHKFLPIIAILLLFSIVIGFLFSTTTYDYYRDQNVTTASIFLGFVSFMGFILYVIRQIKFNSFRIHHHIPFKKSIFVFFSFWLLIFLFTSIPFIPHHVHNWRVKKHINSITDDFNKDTKTLYEGSVFFASEYSNIKKVTLNSQESEVVLTDYYRTEQPLEIEFNKDSITINRIYHQFGYYFHLENLDFSYVESKLDRFPITISNDEAIDKIKKFITVAKKYNIKLLETNPKEVFNKRKVYNKQKNKAAFTLFAIDKITKYPTEAVNKYDSMMHNYQRHLDKSFEWEEPLGILLFSIILAILLWIIISVPIADFGYSILVTVILMVFMGIVASMLNLLTSNDFIIRLAFYILILIIFFLAFVVKKDTRLYNVLKIVSHYSIAVLLFLMFLEVEEANIFSHREEFYVFSTLFLIGMVISIFSFKQVYKNYRLLPK